MSRVLRVLQYAVLARVRLRGLPCGHVSPVGARFIGSPPGYDDVVHRLVDLHEAREISQVHLLLAGRTLRDLIDFLRDVVDDAAFFNYEFLLLVP